jgi:dTDP-4-dehydrorhamnose 3,5-epimerase
VTFQFTRLRIPEVILGKPQTNQDERGFFRETYKYSEFAKWGIRERFVQDNHSHSVRGVLRGLHFQKQPGAQGKLITVVAGEIFDVAVDIRRGSPSFGRWVAEILCAENGHMLYMPPGFAHGFCVLSASADVVYKVTAEYSSELERGIVWNDPQIGVEWPIAKPNLSPRDARLPLLKDVDNNFEFDGSDK